MMSKKAARKAAKDYYKTISLEQLKLISNNIWEQIKQNDKYINAKTVAIYYPLEKEVNLLSLIDNQKIFLMPKLNNSEMDFVIIDRNTKWEINKYNVKEPQNGNICNNIDIMFIPMLATNDKMYRLGYGGGYYDKFLSKYEVKHKVGVLINNFKINFVEEEHDIKLDEIITNKEDQSDS